MKPHREGFRSRTRGAAKTGLAAGLLLAAGHAGYLLAPGQTAEMPWLAYLALQLRNIAVPLVLVTAAAVKSHAVESRTEWGSMRVGYLVVGTLYGSLGAYIMRYTGPAGLETGLQVMFAAMAILILSLPRKQPVDGSHAGEADQA